MLYNAVIVNDSKFNVKMEAITRGRVSSVVGLADNDNQRNVRPKMQEVQELPVPSIPPHNTTTQLEYIYANYSIQGRIPFQMQGTITIPNIVPFTRLEYLNAQYPPQEIPRYNMQEAIIAVSQNASQDRTRVEHNLSTGQLTTENFEYMITDHGVYDSDDSDDEEERLNIADINNMTREELMELQAQKGNVMYRLYLNTSKFPPENFLVDKDENSYKVDEKVSTLTCKHIFHLESIKSWLFKKNSCPICKVTFSTP
ncbi:probable E3 ubiquitin-protein ligase ZFP1 [Impatiens glandulifera]|uniref:probable E3 ubiquitin-protein ligase ZFP1 n=1 Tax=Impatiens glandulifera TaxID=253017 RepID=UPI001FB18EFC|nr:probable E3 ubiquitin-protein ligase ZFP1 [Impatiens glandulifera]